MQLFITYIGKKLYISQADCPNYDRKATTYHLKNGYYQKQLKEFGVNVVNEPIVVDGNIITSYCPETAPNVAFELLKILISEEEMVIIKKAMGF